MGLRKEKLVPYEGWAYNPLTRPQKAHEDIYGADGNLGMKMKHHNCVHPVHSLHVPKDLQLHVRSSLHNNV